MMTRSRVTRLLKMKEQALANSGLQQRALKVALEEAEATLCAMQEEALGVEHDSGRHIQTAGDRMSWGAFLDLLGKRRVEQAQVVEQLSHAFEEKRQVTQTIWRDAKSWEMLAKLYATWQADEEFHSAQKTADDLAAIRTPGPGAAGV